jgi:hypothetical protein
LLQTPTTVQTDEPPEKMRARAERNGYKNGTKFGSLTSQIKYDERLKELLTLPTPSARDWKGKTNPGVVKEGSGCIYGETVPDAVARLFPTPTAIEGVKWTNTWNPNSQMGQSLSAMAGSGMLPTPTARDWKGETNPGVRKEGSGCIYGDTLPDTVMREAKKQDSVGGQSSRLSPLFTEEMMGFPFLWTTLPFLSQNGETNQSKPTETR